MTEVIYLWVIMLWPGSVNHYAYHEFPDMATCEAAVEAAKLEVTQHGESEWAAAMYCAPEGFRTNGRNRWPMKGDDD